ncbi:MAG: hypothetical protein EPO01_08490 [Aquabacterium sp.]|nr:MAG: hypothetical protein EPO12_13595 [Aquabacterium sp.]TAL22735.1 MAG: hypothetical protein EPO01_08490 [Aquabacterium sp.]
MKIAAIATAVSLALTVGLASAAGDHAEGHDHGPHGHHDDEHSAIGEPGTAGKVTRTVDIVMSDNMRFTPSGIQVRQGETVRFKIRNAGQIKHEFVLGTAAELKEHYQAMLKFPDMEHADPNMVTLAAGASGEVIWQFTKSGQVDFACLQPGHYDAGMKGVVNVAKGSGKVSQPGKAAPAAPHPH